MSDLTKEKLAQDAITAKLGQLDGWEQDGDAIKRSYEFEDFLSAIAFINRIAPHAEALDHHPELFNVYNRVDITLTTHDADGLTDYDFALAARLDAEVDG
jgi:4a-hydroxytetrahydrobiopterin dehydratase